MASSQTKPEVEGRLRFLRNPLRLLRQKVPIAQAKGHVFDVELNCGHCGRTWAEQRLEATVCGSETETAKSAESADRAETAGTAAAPKDVPSRDA